MAENLKTRTHLLLLLADDDADDGDIEMNVAAEEIKSSAAVKANWVVVPNLLEQCLAMGQMWEGVLWNVMCAG